MAEGTGMMAQYFTIKEQHKDAVLLFQVGGFFQLYYHDAKLVEKELGAKLISRAVGGGKRVPMCGFPKAAGERYAAALAEKGYRVVLCSQYPEKDSQGRNVRKISQIVEPEGTPENLSEAWDEYLSTHTFTNLKPPERKSRPNGAEKSLLERLAALDLNAVTPMQALILLQKWKQNYVPNINETDGL